MLSIQFGAGIAKNLFVLAGVQATTTMRIGFAAIMMLLVFRPNIKSLTKSDYKWLGLYGASLGFMNILFYMAIQRIPLGIAVAIEFTGPLLVTVFSSRKKLDALWILLAVSGLLLLLPLANQHAHDLDVLGVLMALAAGGFWALYIIFGHHIGSKFPFTLSSSLGMTIAALTAIPFGIVELSTSFTQSGVLLKGLTIAMLSSAIPYTLEMYALSKLSKKLFGILMSLEPVFAALAGFVMLAEVLSLQQWISIAMIISASAGSVISNREK